MLSEVLASPLRARHATLFNILRLAKKPITNFTAAGGPKKYRLKTLPLSNDKAPAASDSKYYFPLANMASYFMLVLAIYYMQFSATRIKGHFDCQPRQI